MAVDYNNSELLLPEFLREYERRDVVYLGRSMAAKDIYHEACVRALEKDGWTITHDPLTIPVEKTNLLIDIGAEKFITAERGMERIAVEVKSFIGISTIQDLHLAVGQFLIYEMALRQSDRQADRTLYLSIRASSYDSAFHEGVGAMVLRNKAIRLLVFDEVTEEITQWIN